MTKCRARVLGWTVLITAWGADVFAADPRPPASVSDTLEQRVLACTACHGKHGEGLQKNEYFPRIGAKPAGYLYNQLVNFREGRRHYPQMTYLVDYLSNAYLREMAEYFSQLKPAFPAPVEPKASKEALARAETLIHKGDPAKKLPACTACHGAALSGMLPATPGLVGHSPEYIVAQFGAWKAGQRKAKAPDCMADIVNALDPAEISAIAAWLGGQRASAETPPDKPQKLPVECGSAQVQ